MLLREVAVDSLAVSTLLAIVAVSTLDYHIYCVCLTTCTGSESTVLMLYWSRGYLQLQQLYEQRTSNGAWHYYKPPLVELRSLQDQFSSEQTAIFLNTQCTRRILKLQRFRWPIRE